MGYGGQEGIEWSLWRPLGPADYRSPLWRILWGHKEERRKIDLDLLSMAGTCVYFIKVGSWLENDNSLGWGGS